MELLVKLSMVYFLVGLFSFSHGLLGLNLNTTPNFEDLLSEAKIFPNFGTPPAQNSTCDYVIIGAGPAGCVLAYRLSANPNNTVCLLEAGGHETIIHKMPIFTIALQATPYNYGYKTVPQKYSCNAMYNKSCGIPQGRSLGGSSSLSYMIYDRGDPQSYDDWAAAGNDGWSYEDVLPFFLRAENASLKSYPNSPYHNYSGSFSSTEDVQFTTKIADAFIQACNDAGLENIDYNDPTTGEGCSKYQATTLKGRRHSAFEAYIAPIQDHRPNLRVFPLCLVTKVLIDPSTKTAYGVNFEHLGKKFTMNATKEVILSAGPYHSPQLLIVSGIGPSNMLKNIGVPEIMDLPVGENLCDHPSFFGPIFTINTTRQTIFVDRITPIDIARFLAGDPTTIVSEISGNEAAAFVKSRFAIESGGNPDIEILMAAATFTVDYGTIFRSSVNLEIDAYNKYFKQLEGKEHWGCLTIPRRPKSKGSLWVESSDVKIPPKINPNYYSNEEDIQVIKDGIKEAIRIASLPGMQAINATLLTTKVPGCEEFEFDTDEYYDCEIRAFILPLNLVMGTCKMGPACDKTTVVDSNMRVHGINRLRVIDSSVIPICIAGHTESTAYMIGEKGADIISRDA